MTEAVQPLPPTTIEKTHHITKIPARWAKLMWRLMALSDGQHQIVIHVNNGQIDTWSFLIPHKIEK